MWLHNMQDVLIPFDTYIIHPEDVQFFWKSCVTFAVFLHLCQTRRLRPDETGFHQSFPYRTQRLSLHFLVVQFLGSQSQRWRNIKVMKSLSLVQDVSFFILLKWYVVFIWYIYIYCFHSFQLPRDDIIASAERQCLKEILCDYKLSQLSEPCQKARKGNHVTKQPLQAEQSRKTSA